MTECFTIIKKYLKVYIDAKGNSGCKMISKIIYLLLVTIIVITYISILHDKVGMVLSTGRLYSGLHPSPGVKSEGTV